MKIKKSIKSLILITTITLSLTGCSNQDSNENLDNNTSIEQMNLDQEDMEWPNYKIALIDDSNIANAIRETLHIVVEGEYNLEQLNAIAEKEALEYVKNNKVNALAIGFYEDEKNIGKGYDMGRVEYVPYGDWGRALDVKTGDYSNFEFVNYLCESRSQYFTKGTPITEDIGETDINLVKADIENLGNELNVSVTKQNDKLIISIIETEESIFEVNELNITAYTDWCLDNIKSDIKTIDFTVKTTNGTIRALLDTSEVSTSNGRYFDSGYVSENIINL